MTKIIPKIAFLLHNVDSGGVERVVVNLLKGLVKYPISIDLVVFEKQGHFLNEVPPEVRIIELPANSRLRRVFPLVGYLRKEKPSILVSQLVQFNVIAIIAKFLAFIPLRILLVEHIAFNSLEVDFQDNIKNKISLINLLRRFFYPKADIVAGVSQGLATELEKHLKMRSGTVKVLYNPVIDNNIVAKSQANIDHPWLQTGQPPVFLAVGRLAPQKDFLTLIKAFAVFRQKHIARLIILGEGAERQRLESEVFNLQLESDVSLLGFTDNPYAYMTKASALVLSSRFEALPTVLIEALACGCQVISTNCPHGPNEILGANKYGWLVNTGDIQQLADAMGKALSIPIERNLLIQRAYDFTVENAVAEYLKMMDLESIVLCEK